RSYCKRYATAETRHLREGPPEGGLGRGVFGAIFHVTDDTDDDVPVCFLRIVRECDTAPNRILPTPIHLRHRRIDHQHGFGVFAGRVGEKAAAENRNAQGAEVLCRDYVVAAMDAIAVLRLEAFHKKAADIVVVAGPGKVAAEAGGLRTRNGAEG